MISWNQKPIADRSIAEVGQVSGIGIPAEGGQAMELLILGFAALFVVLVASATRQQSAPMTVVNMSSGTGSVGVSVAGIVLVALIMFGLLLIALQGRV
jgi:hypothetical protein